MALKSAKKKDIPGDCLPLSRWQAVDFQLDILETLCPRNNRIFINHGALASAFIGSLTNLRIHAFYRNCVKVGNMSRFYTFFPAFAIPISAHYGLHTNFVRDDIIIQKWACPICYHLRSSLIQVFFGVVYPVFMSAAVAFSLARRFNLDAVPPLNHKKPIFKFFLEKTKPYNGRLTLFTVLNFAVGAVVAHMEATENNYFNENIEALISEYDKRDRKKSQNK